MLVTAEIRDDIGVVTLNDPVHRNALSAAIVADFLAALEETRRGRARAVVVTGAGPVFCAGADVRGLLSAGWLEEPRGPTPLDIFRALGRERRLVVAAVNGAAFGGGFELTLCADLVVAAEQASFAMPEVGLGVVPNTGLGKLPRLVGARKALELALTRRRLTAAEALVLGLVNSVVPEATLLEAAVALARDVVTGAPPTAIAVAKESLNRHLACDWQEIASALRRLDPKEWKEGLGAFLERRPARYDRFWSARDD